MNAIIAHADPPAREALRRALGDLCAPIVEADSIARARAALRELDGGVLVAAWQLGNEPVLPGLATEPAFAKWAVLIVHPDVDLAFWRRARAAGAHAVVAYPGADNDQLRARVHAALQAHRSTARPASSSAAQDERRAEVVRPSRILGDGRAPETPSPDRVGRVEPPVLGRDEAPGRGRGEEASHSVAASQVPDVAHVLGRRGQDADFAGLIAWIGALPRCGTTTALSAWALAQAEAGSRIVAVDANLERPGLSMVLCGETALSGWDGKPEPSAARMQRYLMDVPGTDNVRVLPLTWAPGRARVAPDELVARLPAAVDAAERAGAVTVAVDLGSFPPLGEGVPDPRIRWAAREAHAVVVVAPLDVWGIDAAARTVVALRSCGARRVTVLLTQGATEDDAAAVIDLFAGMSPPVHADHVLAVPWRPEIVPRHIGDGPPPIRLDSVLRPGGRSGVSQAVPVRP